MEPRAIVHRVADVQKHPTSSSLNIVSIGGKTNVADQPAPGVPRYDIGDYAVVLVENLILPERLLKHMELWNEARGRGSLAGSKGNRTKARKIADIVSDVALCKIGWTATSSVGDARREICIWLDGYNDWQVTMTIAPDESRDVTPEGVDVTAWLEIIAYEAPVSK